MSSDSETSDEEHIDFNQQIQILIELEKNITESIQVLEKVSDILLLQEQISQQIHIWSKENCLNSSGEKVLVSNNWISIYAAIAAMFDKK